MAKVKTEQACNCHACVLHLELIQQMKSQNELMTKIIDQNGVLMDAILSDAEQETDPSRSLDGE